MGYLCQWWMSVTLVFHVSDNASKCMNYPEYLESFTKFAPSTYRIYTTLFFFFHFLLYIHLSLFLNGSVEKVAIVNSWSNRATSNWEHCLYMTYCNTLKNANMLDAVGFFAVSSCFGIYQYHMWLWHAYLHITVLSGLHSYPVNVCSVCH